MVNFRRVSTSSFLVIAVCAQIDTGGGRVLFEIPYAAVGWWVGWCLTLKMVKIQKVPRVLFEETKNVFLITPIHPLSTFTISMIKTDFWCHITIDNYYDHPNKRAPWNKRAPRKNS